MTFDRAAAWRAIGYSLFLSAVWVVAAAIRPTSTYHLAPLLVAGAAPVGYALTAQGSAKAHTTVLAAAGTGLAVVAGLILATAGKLEGPSLLPSGGALAETLSFAIVAGVAAAAFGAFRPGGPAATDRGPGRRLTDHG